MRARWTAAVVASALLFGRAAPVEAQGRKPPPQKTDPKMVEAKRLFDEGAELYTKGAYEDAIQAWEQSYALSHKPLIFESIANAYERLGQLKKARENLIKWREAAPPDEMDILDTRVKNLDARIAREEQQEATRKAEDDRLKKDRERASSDAQPSRATPAPARADHEAKPFYPGYVMAAAGGVAVVVGLTLDLVAAVRRPDASTACASSGGGQICLASNKDSIESSNTLAVVGDVTWIGGALVGGAGVALAIMLSKPATPAVGQSTPARARAKAVPPSITPTFGRGGAGLSLRQSF